MHTYIVAASQLSALRSYTGKRKRMSMRFADTVLVYGTAVAKSFGWSR